MYCGEFETNCNDTVEGCTGDDRGFRKTAIASSDVVRGRF